LGGETDHLTEEQVAQQLDACSFRGWLPREGLSLRAIAAKVRVSPMTVG